MNATLYLRESSYIRKNRRYLLSDMPATSTKQANTAKLAGAVKSGKFPASKAGPSVKAMAKMPMNKLRHFMKLKENMSEEQKRRLLVGLRKLKEGYASTTTGGEFGVDTTDIVNPDNLVSEDEYTSQLRPEPKVVAKTFDTQSDFDSYVNQRRGIEMTPKEIQAVSVMAEQTMPSSTPVQPQQQQPIQQQPPQQNQPPQKSAPPKDEKDDQETDMTSDDKIRVQKSQTFVDETQGADMLANFLAEIDLAKEKPISGDKFHMRYEMTDDFGNNTTTVIKKLKEGNQFCWTAFSKYESPEEEGNPKEKDDEEK